jgi:hypothetical protein
MLMFHLSEKLNHCMRKMSIPKKKKVFEREETTMATTPVINEHALIEWRLNSLFPSDVTLGVHYEYKEERERERERQ